MNLADVQRKKRVIWAWAFIVLSISGCLVRRQVQPQIPTRSFDLEDLFIDVTVFPDGWSSSGERSPACTAAPLDSGCESVEAEMVFFYYTGGGAREEIHVYTDQGSAAGDFGRMQNRFYSGNNYSTPWATPDELPYASPIAAQSYFACNTHGGAPFCQFLGQYEEFIVVFHVHKKLITYQDLEHVLEAIDQRMASYLGIVASQQM